VALVDRFAYSYGRRMSRKITFVLPVTLHEKGRSWRAPVNGTALLRTQILLQSFVTNYNHQDLEQFFVISPDRDAVLLADLLRSCTKDPRYRVLSEIAVCPDLEKAIDLKTGQTTGWRIQQMLKLAISSYVSSDYYVTLDSDIVLLRRCSHDDLVADCRALTNCETADDYARMYTDPFARREVYIKRRRYARSAEILGRRFDDTRTRFYGETPVVMRTSEVSRLLEYITDRSGAAWSEVLAQQGGWTEYGLYYNFLEMSGQIDRYCLFRGCNCVLNLEHSVWHASERYRGTRLYDAEHFAKISYASGPFVAIQSWLPVSSWLPEQWHCIECFYQALGAWIGI
jgi:hypothetical protein